MVGEADFPPIINDFTQCIYRTGSEDNTHFGWNWNWPNANNNVKSYPEVIYGKKPWSSSSTSQALPIKIENMAQNITQRIDKLEKLMDEDEDALDQLNKNGSLQSNLSGEYQLGNIKVQVDSLENIVDSLIVAGNYNE